MRDKEPDETWPVDLGMMTKDGRHIDLVFSINVEEPNRGFVCDEIVAYVEGERAGFLRTMYVPSQSFQKFYPSGPLNYVNNIDGISLFDGQSDWREGTDLLNSDLTTINHFVSKLNIYRIVYDLAPFDSKEAFLNWFQKDFMKSRWYTEKQKRFDEFCKDVDQPIVSYSSTCTPNRKVYEKSWQGLGIGRALYIGMALELEKRGMALRRSSMASESATRLWNTFERDGVIEPGPLVNNIMQPRLSPELIREKLDIALPTSRRLKV